MPKYCSNCGKALQEGENCSCKEEVAATKKDMEETTEKQDKGTAVLTKPEKQDKVNQKANQKANVIENTNTTEKANATENENATENNAENNANQEEIFTTEKAKEVMNSTSNYLKKMFEFSVAFIKTPLTTMKHNAVNHDFKKGLFFGGLQSVLFAIITLIITHKSISLFNMNIFYEKIPYFNLFLKSFLFNCITFFLLPISFFLTSKLFKSKSNIKSLITIAGISTIPLIIATGIFLIGIFISLSSVILLFGANACLVILTYIGLGQTASIDENKVIYWTVTGFTLFFVLLTLSLRIINPFAFISMYNF